MDERTEGAMLLALGGVALRLGLTDAALAYVRPGFRPLLSAAGAVLVLLGAGCVIRALRSERGASPHPHPGNAQKGSEILEESSAPSTTTAPLPGSLPGPAHGSLPSSAHEAGHGSAVGWLLLLPLLALLLVAPPPLGAFAASRQSAAPPVDTAGSYADLPAPVDGAVEVPVLEFVFRALYDEQRSLDGVTVRLTGFVSDHDVPGGYTLSRFVVSCCAADGRPVHVRVLDDGPPPPVDSWVEVEGRWVPPEGSGGGETSTEPPVLEGIRRTPIAPPSQPYEY